MSRNIIIIGLFVSAVTLATGAYIVLLSGKFMSGTYTLYAFFTNGNGIIEDGAVKISGIKVGRVKSLKLVEERARVEIEINKDVTVHANDTLKKTSQGVLGAGFLEIVPKKTGAVLQNGDEMTNVDDSGLFDAIAKNAATITEDVGGIAKQINDYIRESGILDQVSVITKQMELTLKSVQQVADQLGQTVQVNTAAINQTAQAVALIAGELERFLVSDKSSDNQDLSDTLTAIKSTLQNIETITRKLTEGEGTIGKLLTDETLYNNLTAASQNINNLTSRAAGLSTAIDYRFEGLFTEQGQFAAKNHLNLRITPPGSPRYYQVGITYGGPHSIEGVPKYSARLGDSDLKINLLFAQNLFKNYVTVRGGLIENTGGFGIDIRPVKQWEISAEAFDFGKGKGAYLRAYTSFYPFFDPASLNNPLKWLYFGGGVDDILSSYRRTYFFSVGVRIQDEFIYDAVRLVPVASGAASIAR